MNRLTKKEQTKSFIKQMPSKKRKLWLALIILAPAITVSVILWLFTLHGNIGLFFWFPVFAYAILIVIGLSLAVPILAFLDLKIAIKKKNRKHMPSRIIWGLSVLAIIIPSATFILIVSNAFHNAGDKAPQLLICDGTGEHGIPNMAVTYWTQEARKDSLRWGPGSLSNLLEDDAPTNQHTFVFTGLLPNTTYIYQINEAGDIYSFKTPPAENDRFRFAVSSDPHFGRSESRNDITIKLLEHIATPTNNFSSFFMLGDMVEYGFLDGEWKEGLDAISPYTSRIPFRPLIGNHDTVLGGNHYYLEYFYPEKMPLDTGTRLYQHVKVNNINIFLLDLEWGIEEYLGAQQTWFEAQLATVSKSDWTIVMSHCFFYSSGTVTIDGTKWYDHPDMIRIFEPLFKEYGINMVFSGHNHHAEILQKDGVTYGVIGTMGGHPDPPASYISPYSIWYQQIADEDKFGFFEVDIDGNNASITFRNQHYSNLYQITISK